MPRAEYTNLSIPSKRYDKLRRTFDTTSNTEETFTSWAMSVLENSLDREKWLANNYPNITVVKVIDNGLILDDNKTNDVIKVTRLGKKIVSTIDNPIYTLYASLHPEFPLEQGK